MAKKNTEMLYVERIALAIWTARQSKLPMHSRPQAPDEIDMLSGAWDEVVEEALLVLEGISTPSPYMKVFLDKPGAFDVSEALSKIVDTALKEYHDVYSLPLESKK